jgi:metallo-beta-lactamase family protein
VRAKIHTLGGFSAHASQSQLIDWLKHFKGEKPRLYLVHGEEEAKNVLQAAVKTHNWQAHIPTQGQEIKL